MTTPTKNFSFPHFVNPVSSTTMSADRGTGLVNTPPLDRANFSSRTRYPETQGRRIAAGTTRISRSQSVGDLRSPARDEEVPSLPPLPSASRLRAMTSVNFSDFSQMRSTGSSGKVTADPLGTSRGVKKSAQQLANHLRKPFSSNFSSALKNMMRTSPVTKFKNSLEKIGVGEKDIQALKDILDGKTEQLDDRHLTTFRKPSRLLGAEEGVCVIDDLGEKIKRAYQDTHGGSKGKQVSTRGEVALMKILQLAEGHKLITQEAYNDLKTTLATWSTVGDELSQRGISIERIQQTRETFQQQRIDHLKYMDHCGRIVNRLIFPELYENDADKAIDEYVKQNGSSSHLPDYQDIDGLRTVVEARLENAGIESHSTLPDFTSEEYKKEHARKQEIENGIHEERDALGWEQSRKYLSENAYDYKQIERIQSVAINPLKTPQSITATLNAAKEMGSFKLIYDMQVACSEANKLTLNGEPLLTMEDVKAIRAWASSFLGQVINLKK